jgi:hypothetical protein
MGIAVPGVSVSYQGCNRTTYEEILTKRWLMPQIRHSSE